MSELQTLYLIVAMSALTVAILTYPTLKMRAEKGKKK